MKIWWQPVEGAHFSWPPRTAVSTIVSEIKRLYEAYTPEAPPAGPYSTKMASAYPRRFVSVALDRENGSAVIRTFRELLASSNIAVKAMPVTEEKTDHGCRREDLLFSLKHACDAGYLKVAPDSDWLYALDSSIKWHATDSDVLGRSCCLAWKLACLPPVGERVAAIV